MLCTKCMKNDAYRDTGLCGPCTHNAAAKAPLECVVCGSATGPLHPVDGDHAGWLCPKCSPPEDDFDGNDRQAEAWRKALLYVYENPKSKDMPKWVTDAVSDAAAAPLLRDRCPACGETNCNGRCVAGA